MKHAVSAHENHWSLLELFEWHAILLSLVFFRLCANAQKRAQTIVQFKSNYYWKYFFLFFVFKQIKVFDRKRKQRKTSTILEIILAVLIKEASIWPDDLNLYESSTIIVCEAKWHPSDWIFSFFVLFASSVHNIPCFTWISHEKNKNKDLITIQHHVVMCALHTPKRKWLITVELLFYFFFKF